MSGDHDQPARVAVEAMDDPGPLDAGDPAPGRAVAVRQERVDQRPAGVPRRRVDDEAGRLVEDQQVVVLVDDLERDIGLGGQIEGDDLGDVEPQLRADAHDRVRLEGFAAGRQPAVGDELLDEAAGQARGVGDVAVDPAGRAVGHAQDADPGRVRGINHPTASRASRSGPGRSPPR